MKNIKIIIEKTLDKCWNAFGNENIDEMHVYDFDDTLVRTDSVIYIVNKLTSERREIHPHEFHEYHLKDNEKFDLESFDSVAGEIQVLPHFSKFLNDYQKFGPKKVAILTARPYSEGVYTFLRKYNISDIEVAAVGDPDPAGDVASQNAERKKTWLKDKILTNPIKKMCFYDDNKANIMAARELADEFSDVKFHIELVPTR